MGKPIKRAPASGAANNQTISTPARSAIDAWFAERYNLTLDQLTLAHAFTHPTTHRTIRFILLTARAAAGRTRPHTARWLTPHQLDDLPLPNPQRHAIHHLT